MSADPVTLAVISFGVQAAGTYSQIQAQKATNKAIIREYETEKKYNQLKEIGARIHSSYEPHKQINLNHSFI